MKKKKRIVLCVFFAALLVAGGTALFQAGVAKGAANAVPGSQGDPLVTKSYLEKRLTENNGVSFRTVTLTAGDVISLKAGAQLMLYSGNAEVTGKAGLVNMTTGELFKSGNSVLRYHLYLVPEEEAGMKASGKVTLFVWEYQN